VLSSYLIAVLGTPPGKGRKRGGKKKKGKRKKGEREKKEGNIIWYITIHPFLNPPVQTKERKEGKKKKRGKKKKKEGEEGGGK